MSNFPSAADQQRMMVEWEFTETFRRWVAQEIANVVNMPENVEDEDALEQFLELLLLRNTPGEEHHAAGLPSDDDPDGSRSAGRVTHAARVTHARQPSINTPAGLNTPSNDPGAMTTPNPNLEPDVIRILVHMNANRPALPRRGNPHRFPIRTRVYQACLADPAIQGNNFGPRGDLLQRLASNIRHYSPRELGLSAEVFEYMDFKAERKRNRHRPGGPKRLRLEEDEEEEEIDFDVPEGGKKDHFNPEGGNGGGATGALITA